MKKLLIILVLVCVSLVAKAPPLAEYSKDVRTHLYWKELQKTKREAELRRFLLALAIRESANNWKSINSYNYIGKYQFGIAALKEVGLGHITPRKFKENPHIFNEELQDVAAKALMQRNEYYLRDVMWMIGKTIGGIEITKSGLLAAAHLGGAGGVKSFLKSQGKKDFKDGYGTPISSYLKKFAEFRIQLLIIKKSKQFYGITNYKDKTY